MARFSTIPTRDSVRDEREREAQAAIMAPLMPDRLARRKAARRGLAECAAASDEYLALRDELARIQSEMDAAADEHVKMCEPIQTELKRIGADSVTRVLEGKPAVSAREDKRRGELLVELGQLNAKLEERLRNLKASAVPIEARSVEAGKRGARRPEFVGELVATAEPSLVAQMKVCERTATLAKQRLDTALERSKQYPADPVWALELTTAAQLYDEAKTEADAAYQALLTSE